MGFPMRHLVLALAVASCAPFVRPSEGEQDAGVATASVLEINGALLTPGVLTQIAPNAVATSPKFYLRKASGDAPDCWYGVFIADPSAAPTTPDGGQPNNGVLLSALGDMAKINGDATLGGNGRSTCPYPQSYAVGGNIPDNVKIGDELSVTGYFEPYCNYYNSSLGKCASDLFPEFTPDSPGAGPSGVVTDLTPGVPSVIIPPLLVQPSQISNVALNAIQYGGELVQVQNVTVSSSDAFGDVILNQADLWITPLIDNVSVAVTPGFGYCSVTGNLHFNGEPGDWEVRPRTQADLVPAPCP